MPRIENWKPELEQAATQALGLRVEIGALQAESAGLLPQLTLHELRLYDAQGREALRLPRVLAIVNPGNAASIRVLQKSGLRRIGVHAVEGHAALDLFAALATLFVGLVSARALSGLTATELKAGMLIGVSIMLGYGLQTYGLQTISSSQSAFRRARVAMPPQ